MERVKFSAKIPDAASTSALLAAAEIDAAARDELAAIARQACGDEVNVRKVLLTQPRSVAFAGCPLLRASLRTRIVFAFSLLGVPAGAWDYMKDGKTHHFDLTNIGVPFKLMFGAAIAVSRTVRLSCEARLLRNLTTILARADKPLQRARPIKTEGTERRVEAELRATNAFRTAPVAARKRLRHAATSRSQQEEEEAS
jgi:hypothetical protein